MLILILFVEDICREPLTEGVYGFVMCSCLVVICLVKR